MTRTIDTSSPLARYTRASEIAAGEIIEVYSTSFGTATRLLGARHRTHVRNIYALVRVADELVDGATAEAGMTPDEQRLTLDRFEEEIERAVRSGYSSNPIVHAFARTAGAAGIDGELTRPFFSSMRTDLGATDAAGPSSSTDPQLRFGGAEHASYVYGSAEVVGLMCLRVFIRDESPSAEERRALEHGARRLGAAFQNVNFLRDLADDTERLGRSYLSERGRIDDETKDGWVSEIRAQLSDARAALPLLPKDARIAVGAALRLFSRLADRIARTPADDLYRRRVRVPTAEKSWLIARALLDMRKERAR
ncbi:squalene/phytoene synthase family protein [Leucobacter sp. wl10]|uniref:phytoene/squalene synthase family protein n=1 Tax=Leucobacter sp. wl10 TaxID=2304677 RepID=UPI000E5B232A|nr:squalene/phytoene synthase family protein [Leucobacter sp. wl10]RGE20403.1 phytoene synthase [Leucobacter sp. wl10]